MVERKDKREQKAPLAREVMHTESGDFLRVAEVGVQPEPGTAFYEIVREVINQVAQTGKPVIFTSPSEKTKTP